MPPKAKKSAPSDQPASRYVPSQKYVWIELVDPDDPDAEGMLQLKVRSELSFDEALPIVVQSKEDERTVDELRDLVAPFVVDWNFYDADGAKVPPPAEAGGEQFKLLPIQNFWRVQNFLVERGVGRHAVKRIAPTGSNRSTSMDGAAPDLTVITNPSNETES